MMLQNAYFIKQASKQLVETPLPHLYFKAQIIMLKIKNLVPSYYNRKINTYRTYNNKAT